MGQFVYARIKIASLAINPKNEFLERDKIF